MRKFLKTIAFIGAVACLAAGCNRQTDEPSTEGETEEVAEDTTPTGDDYHSTVVRARRRTKDRMEEVQEARTEQVEEEKSFSDKEPETP